jgi:hypothetical protein
MPRITHKSEFFNRFPSRNRLVSCRPCYSAYEEGKQTLLDFDFDSQSYAFNGFDLDHLDHLYDFDRLYNLYNLYNLVVL